MTLSSKSGHKQWRFTVFHVLIRTLLITLTTHTMYYYLFKIEESNVCYLQVNLCRSLFGYNSTDSCCYLHICHWPFGDIQIQIFPNRAFQIFFRTQLQLFFSILYLGLFLKNAYAQVHWICDIIIQKIIINGRDAFNFAHRSTHLNFSRMCLYFILQ